MMTPGQIDELKARAIQGGVYWNDGDNLCHLVSHVSLNWVEFKDEPDLTEPAAILQNGGAVALLNVTAAQFVTMQPALS